MFLLKGGCMNPGDRVRIKAQNEHGQPSIRAGVLCEFMGYVWGNQCRLLVCEDNDVWPDWRTSGVRMSGDVVVEPEENLE